MSKLWIVAVSATGQSGGGVGCRSQDTNDRTGHRESPPHASDASTARATRLRRVGIIRHPSVRTATDIIRRDRRPRLPSPREYPVPRTPQSPPMPSPAPAPCLHELRPGTKVCLHCRRAEREARAAHRNRIFVRITLTGMAIAIGVVGVRAGIEAFKRGSLPQIPILMAATTKAIVESLPGTPSPST